MEKEEKYVASKNCVYREEDGLLAAALVDNNLYLFQIGDDCEVHLHFLKENPGLEDSPRISVDAEDEYLIHVFLKDEQDLISSKDMEQIVDKYICNKEEFLLDYHEGYHETAHCCYVRMLNWYYWDATKDIMEALGEISPDFKKDLSNYKKRKKEYKENTHLLWKGTWIGFTDSEDEYINVEVDEEGGVRRFRLERVGSWCPQNSLSEDMEFFETSNIDNAVLFFSCEGELGKENFMNGLRKVLEASKGSGYGCQISLEEMNFNFDEMAERINGLDLGFLVNEKELQELINDVKGKPYDEIEY